MKNVNSIIWCLFEVIVGILLMVNLLGFTSRIIVTAGIVLSLACSAVILKAPLPQPPHSGCLQVLL